MAKAVAALLMPLSLAAWQARWRWDSSVAIITGPYQMMGLVPPNRIGHEGLWVKCIGCRKRKASAVCGRTPPRCAKRRDRHNDPAGMVGLGRNE